MYFNIDYMTKAEMWAVEKFRGSETGFRWALPAMWLTLIQMLKRDGNCPHVRQEFKKSVVKNRIFVSEVN